MIRKERQLLEEITVTRTVREQAEGLMSAHSHAKAVASLQTNGVCVLRGLFSADDAIRWGEDALSDLEDAVERLVSGTCVLYILWYFR